MSGMTDLDRAIVATLRAEAREAEMTTDTPLQYEELSSRLDDVDRSRSRMRWTVGLVAVAAVAVLAVVLAVLRPAPAPETPPADQQTGVRYDGSAFDRPFRMNLPAWVSDVMTSPEVETREHLVFNVCPGDPDCMGLDVYAFTYLPDGTGPATYAGMLAAYDNQDRNGSIKLYDKQVSSVSGREMTTFSVTTRGGGRDALGCDSTKECEGFYVRNEDRYALIDAEGGPLLIGIRSFADNPHNAERLPQLAASFATLELLPGRSDTLPEQMQGIWETTLTKDTLASTLQTANLGPHTDVLAREFGVTSRPVTLRLYVDSQNLRLYTVASDGTEEMLDAHTCSITSDRLTCTVEAPAGVETLVIRYAVTGQSMRLTYLSDAGPWSIKNTPNEALQRALYSASAWEKSTG